ncbi:MAG: sugar phosphate isomerase/epimerase [Candidatus Aminicenantes bacterium]|nr:sugar phosphate isomerase/epimerase [Candidatus Aminicenantes bacterium]
MKKIAALIILAFLAGAFATADIRHISPALAEKVAKTDYAAVRIKNFPIASEAWTFRKFTFFETIQKLKELGVPGIEAFPDQALAAEFPGARFSENMTPEQIARVKDVLKAAGVTLYGYGVVDIGRTEASMRKVFDFARTMGIQVIVCEPEDDDFTLLQKLVEEYDIKIAIHNHPAPAKYNLPETVFQHVEGKDPRIGSCADSGHWMRGMNDPREAFKLLDGRILDVHLKDRNDFGTAKGVDDVPWGSGKGFIRDLLAELTLQDYDGWLTMEYENEAEVGDPMPAFRKSVEFVKSVTYYDGYEQIFRRSWGRYEKDGWNHYGPGHFEVDEKTAASPRFRRATITFTIRSKSRSTTTRRASTTPARPTTSRRRFRRPLFPRANGTTSRSNSAVPISKSNSTGNGFWIGRPVRVERSGTSSRRDTSDFRTTTAIPRRSSGISTLKNCKRHCFRSHEIGDTYGILLNFSRKQIRCLRIPNMSPISPAAESYTRRRIQPINRRV